MQVTILGSGAREGIPAAFCLCNVCKDAKNLDSKNNRTRPEILIKTEEGQFLLEISPDIRTQSTKFNLSNINDFLISHWHFDHMYGLLELDVRSKFVSINAPKLYCSQNTSQWLNQNFGHISKEIKVIKAFQAFTLFGVQITPIPVYHMKEQDKETKDKLLDNTFGFILEHNNIRIVYLADYYKISPQSFQLIKHSDVIICDGTYLFEEMFPNNYLHNELKLDQDHLHGEDIINFAKSLEAKKIIFHSISHQTEKSHFELQNMLPKGMYISYDGMNL